MKNLYYFLNSFNNLKLKTNGVTPRRWVRCANPGLSAILSEATGSDDWILDMDLLKKF